MDQETQRLIAQADDFLKKRNFRDAAQMYQLAANRTPSNDQGVVELLKKAAQAYEKIREREAAVKCYVDASHYLQGTEKAETFLAGWKLYVLAIAGYGWECCFEWRGDRSHDEDHAVNQELIGECRTKGENLLREAWEVEGANRDTILRLARDECKKRKEEGGWGEQACRDMVEAVTGKKIP